MKLVRQLLVDVSGADALNLLRKHPGFYRALVQCVNLALLDRTGRNPGLTLKNVHVRQTPSRIQVFRMEGYVDGCSVRSGRG